LNPGDVLRQNSMHEAFGHRYDTQHANIR